MVAKLVNSNQISWPNYVVSILVLFSSVTTFYGDLTAEGNVEVPAVYAGATPYARKQRATALLTELGLGNKTKTVQVNFLGAATTRLDCTCVDEWR